MVTAGNDFSHFNQIGSHLIFDMRIKQHRDNEQIAQGISGTQLVRVVW